MLLAFEVENYRSIRDRCVLNLVRPARAAVGAFPHPDVAPAVAIFGPNASGKTNLLRALNTMFWMVRRSALDTDESLNFTPYALGDAPRDSTLFQVVVRLDGVRYDYGFTYDASRIVSEWLYAWPKSRQRVLFERNDDVGWHFGDSLSGANQALSRATRQDALLLSTAKVLNHEQLSDIHDQFANLVRQIGADPMGQLLQRTLEHISRNPARQAQITYLMTRADFGVTGLNVEEVAPMPDEMREALQQFIVTLNPKSAAEDLATFDRVQLTPQLEHLGSAGNVPIPFGWESVGTQNFLAMLGPILDRLESGGVLVVDEIDTSLHPRLVSELVRLFQDPRTNPNQAQLILSTHDVTVMMNTGDYNVLKRDQVWFVEKDDIGATRLYPLLDFKPREAEVFSRNYLMGRYGAVPAIDDSAFVELWSTD